MGERQLSEAEVLGRVLDARLAEVHVALPGRVHAWDSAAQVADVAPGIWPDGEELPILPAVPVAFPRGASRGLAWDLAQGDPGLLVFAEVDLSQWRQSGEAAPPPDLGRHNLQSAIFLPGLHPRGGETSIPAGAAVLFGADVRLGGATASEKAVHGDAYRAAHLAWAGAVSAAITALGGDVTGALSTLGTATAAALSAKVKVD